jgi:5S rRNA maturation endonuclease (ribonuclease M5)
MISHLIDPVARAEHVKAELNSLPGKKRTGSRFTMIQCPFHSDDTPSGQLKHDVNKPASVGFFACRGCGESISWNIFAERLGLQPFQRSDSPDVPEVNQDYLKQALLGEEEDDEGMKYAEYTLSRLNQEAADKMGLPDLYWRTFSFQFLTSIGARMFTSRGFIEDTGEFGEVNYIFLPIYVSGTLRGYIRARPFKPKDPSVPTYMNARGGWSRTYGLFPYDASVELMNANGLKTMVLVEGPRDALRLLSVGIPALAILGTHSWTPNKVRLLEKTGADRIVLCMDADRAGRQATKLLYTGRKEEKSIAPALKNVFQTSSFELKEYRKNPLNGQEKIDPASAPKRALADLKSIVES